MRRKNKKKPKKSNAAKHSNVTNVTPVKKNLEASSAPQGSSEALPRGTGDCSPSATQPGAAVSGDVGPGIARTDPPPPTPTPAERGPGVGEKSEEATGHDTTWWPRFLEILGNSCNVTLAAYGAGITKMTAYRHRKLFPDFAEQWDFAIQNAIELLEAEAYSRAKKKSDLLLIFLLKGNKPEKYRDQLDVHLRKLSDSDLIRQVQESLRRDGQAGAETSGAGTGSE